MIEMTFDQPLATLAVEGVVTVLVGPAVLCPECGGLGEVERWGGGGRGRRRRPFWGRHCCRACDGDGLARWPAEVTIRSSDEEPWVNDVGQGPGPGPFRTRRTGTRLVRPDGPFYLTDMRDGNRIPLPLGEVVGTVTVEAAVPITGGIDEHDGDQIVWESGDVITHASKGEHFVAEGWSLAADGVTHKMGRWAPSEEFGLFDVSDQLAFQDFPVGHTALILGGPDQ